MTEAEGYETYVVGPLTRILDNFSKDRYEELQDAARTAVAEDMGSLAPDLATYETAWRRGDLDDYRAVVGAAIAEKLNEWLDDDYVPEMWRLILGDILDLHAASVRELLGANYLPEPVDMEGILASDDETGDDE